ncbi:MAG: hypothetical protein PHV27_04995, partial [Mesotoga sp.]|nr:hypothetical protein [Mesotoga sp.]
MKRHFKFLIFVAIVAVVVILSAFSFTEMWEDPPIIPGSGVTEIRMLSEWLPSIEGTMLDTEVYVIKGSEEGGKFLLLGGTHPNEPGGTLAAVVFIENVSAVSGTIYVIPRSNHSAFTHNDAMEGSP